MQAPSQKWSNHSQSLWRTCLTRKIKNSKPSVKDHNVLDDGVNTENKSKIPIGNRKCIFWQTSINHQRPKLRILINGIVIVGLIDTEADMSMITPESWHSKWPLQEVNIQLLEIGTISQVK